jgi:hypothetical protein
MIVHYDNAVMTIKVCTLVASSTRYDAFKLSELRYLTYIVLSSVAQVRICLLRLQRLRRSKGQTLMKYRIRSLSALLERRVVHNTVLMKSP